MSVTFRSKPADSGALLEEIVKTLGLSSPEMPGKLETAVEREQKVEEISNSLFQKILVATKKLRCERDQAHGKLKDFQKISDELDEKRSEIKISNRKLEKALELKTKLETEMKDILAPVQSERDQFKRELDASHKAYKQLQSRFDKSEEEIRELNQCIADLKKRAQSLVDKEKNSKRDAACQVALVPDKEPKVNHPKSDVSCQAALMPELQELETTCWLLHQDNQRLVIESRRQRHMINRLRQRVEYERGMQIVANNQRQHFYNENFFLYGILIRNGLMPRRWDYQVLNDWDPSSHETSSSSDSRSVQGEYPA